LKNPPNMGNQRLTKGEGGHKQKKTIKTGGFWVPSPCKRSYTEGEKGGREGKKKGRRKGCSKPYVSSNGTNEGRVRGKLAGDEGGTEVKEHGQKAVGDERCLGERNHAGGSAGL